MKLRYNIFAFVDRKYNLLKLLKKYKINKL